MVSRSTTHPPARWSQARRRISLVAAGGLVAGASFGMAVGAATSGATTARAGKHGGSSSFTPPRLKGAKIVFASGAQQQVSDTQLYVVTKILNSWGAKASIINTASDSIAVTEVLSGAANIGYIGTNGTIDSGLLAFGPALPHIDYQLVTAPRFKTIQSLVGKGTGGYSKPNGLENEMWDIALHAAHLKPNAIPIIVAGGQSSRVTALLTGRIQAAFLDSVHYHQLINTPGGSGFNDAMNMSTAAPQLADSTLSASNGWLSHHRNLAIAVDEAWLEAAKFFHSNAKGWIADAYHYSNESGGADENKAAATLQYHIYQKDQEFLDTPSIFSAAHAHYNEVIANSVGALPNGAPKLSTWFTLRYWSAATKAFGLK